MDLRQAQQQLTTQLLPLYGKREAELIADWVMEHLTGRKRIDRLIGPAEPLSAPLLDQYEKYRDQLLAHRPVQYVLHESWFAGMKFYVDENVLIPRPETEELVEWIAETIAATRTGTLLDVGTGSGCIAIALARQFPALPIHACDISPEALQVAARNAAQLQAPIHFHHLDFLDPRHWADFPPVRWLVSNPPYIPLQEKEAMAQHVTAAEPALALFVPDNDPLLFYRALTTFAQQRLAKDGALFVEIHEDLATPVIALLRAAGFQDILLKKDMQGKDRMIRMRHAP